VRLDGSVRHVNGILFMACLAQELGFESPFVPVADTPKAAWIRGIDVYPVETPNRLVTHFRDCHPIEPCRATLDLDAEPPTHIADFQDIKEQEHTQEHQLRVYCREIVGAKRPGPALAEP